MKLKGNVRLRGLRPEMLMGHWCVQTVFADRDYRCVVTSANDSGHGHGSLHFGGSALDYRMKHVALGDKGTIVAAVKEALTNEFDVLFEGEGTANEHLHVEYQPKSA